MAQPTKPVGKLVIKLHALGEDRQQKPSFFVRLVCTNLLLFYY
jgi:hypothetical protein